MKDTHKTENMNLETVMSERFSRYSKSIIQQRAIPDVRDGLKPVQRRIIFAMDKAGNTHDKAYRKSAKAVGDVMGNLHPHGDSSIYEALIHMSQPWKMRLPLIDLHGNNGSIDDDPPAAMRYTEARLSLASNEMMRDIKKNTVSWVPNFDDTEYEPTVLPSRFPNLLVNGATGISSGYATNIPPHNLGEVINALIYLQSHPNATLDELMHFIKGPDFPTGGIIQGEQQLKRAYATGRGKIIVRSRAKIKKIRGGRKIIHVSEIPYGVNKLNLVKRINGIRLNHKVNGIAEVIDESDRHGLSIVISLKRNADAQGVLNYLYKNTDLQIPYHFNVVAIDHMQPKCLSLRSILSSYLEFQRQIIKSRTKYDLKQAYQHQEIVKGLIKALSMLNDVIRVIRRSRNRSNASQNLVKNFNFTQRQADSIVALRLYRLTNTDITALKERNHILNLKISYFKNILSDYRKLDDVLRVELRQIQRKYATPRRTTIQRHIQKLHVSKKVTVPSEDVMVLVSHDGYLKRSSWRSFKASKPSENGLKPGDYPIFMKHLNTRNHLFMFTNKGHLIYRPVIGIKDAKWKRTGQHISQEIGLGRDERIIAIYSFKKLKSAGSFLITTDNGYTKFTTFNNLKPGRTYRSHAQEYMKLRNKNANVVNVTYIPKSMPKCSALLISKYGFADRFLTSEIPTSGPKASGVKAMNLKGNDLVADVQLVTDYDRIAMITKQGTFRIQNVNVIPISHRNRRGIHTVYHTKHQTHFLADFIKINPNEVDTIKIHTNFRKTIPIMTNNIPPSKLDSRGKNIIKTNRIGIPQSLTD